MKKRFTRILAAFALLVGLTIPMGMWGQTTVASFSRSGSTNNTTGGTFSTTFSAKDGFYQDNNGDCYMQILNTSAYWTTTPTSISFTASIGGGSGNTDLTNPVCVALLDAEGTVIEGTQTNVTSHITNAGGDSYNISIPVTNNVYGVKLSHVKQSGYNVRYFSFTLSYVADGGQQPTTYTVTVNQSTGGTISATPTSAAAGTTITLTATPAEGYSFDSWSITPNTVEINNNQFTMPASNVTVTAQWTQSGGGTGNTITITQDKVADFTNAYNWYDWSDNNVSGKLYAYKSGGMQFNSSKTAYWVYNSSPVPGRITSITMTKASGTDRSWTLRVGNTTLTSTTGGTQMGNAQTVGTNGATWEVTGNYSYFLLYVSGGATVISDIVINYEEVTTPSITFEPASINLGNVQVGQEVSTTFSVSQANLTSGVSLSANVGGLSVSNIEQGASATQVTWTYTPSAAGAINATITATSGTLSETLNITGTAKAAHNITVATMTNGSVTASSNSAIEGETITLTVTPSAGYKLEDLTVTNTSTEEQVTVTNNTFEMPNADVTVNATFTAIQTLTVAEALDSSNEYPLNGVYVSGIISQIEEVNTSYHNATYYISDDGTQNNELYVFRGKNLGNTDFNSTNDILVGDQVVVFGNVVDYQGTIEFATNNYIYSRIPAAQYTINFYVNGQMDNGLQMSILQSPNAVLGTLPTPAASSIPAGYEFYGWMVKTANEYYNATTAPEIVDANTSVSGDMDLAAVFRIGTTEGGWTLSNALPADNEEVILAALDGDDYYAMNGPSGIGFTIANGVITGNVPNAVFTAEMGLAGNYLKQGNNYLHFNSGALKLASGTTNGDITYTATNGGFTLMANSRYMTYNESTHGFSVSTDGANAATMYIFKFVGGETTYSDYTTRVYTLPVTSYGTSTGGYYLIASPVSTNPGAAGMITDELGAQATPETATYDLYSFDQVQPLEWINYRQGGFNTIEPGKGYLYANKNNVTLTFAGEAYDGEGYIELTYEDGAEFAGWNLIGNPFGTEATLNMPYYRLQEGGAELNAETEEGAVNAMEGVFVKVIPDPETGDFDNAQFSTESKSGQNLALNLSCNERSASVIDRAIVRFDGGLTLPKFQLNPNNTKIYVTEGNKDYAIVRSAAEAEMPISFRASENGTYTLAVEAENVEMNYLHLIDNLTGMDVDLLQTPSYTFDAKTSDYASRFRLVFSANSIDEQNAETFAYFNGTNWTVSNVGDATLQVVDVTGRTVANQMINGNAELNLNQPAGVYVIRLVNGDNVKTQKVVVR